MNIDAYQIFGWIGMALLILAYALLSNKKLNPHTKTYHFLNLLGALGIVVSTLKTKSWPALTLNIIWIIIAIFYIYKISRIKPKYKQLR
jgi:hypothetical protein